MAGTRETTPGRTSQVSAFMELSLLGTQSFTHLSITICQVLCCVDCVYRRPSPSSFCMFPMNFSLMRWMTWIMTHFADKKLEIQEDLLETSLGTKTSSLHRPSGKACSVSRGDSDVQSGCLCLPMWHCSS